LAWLRAVETAAVHARLTLDRLAAWEARARAATAALSGRTPGKLISALLATPALSAEMAARLTGASQAAALRNITRFEAQGLVREVTGQGRFRVWVAAA
jgi:DNA-binding IclR family transcriptional regulator